MVTITVRRSTMVRPSEPTPRHCLWSSNLDLAAAQRHTTFIHFYRRTNGSTDFFDAERMRGALAQVLVPFYPMAGRLARDEKGRIEIDCDCQGVLFIEADSGAIMDDFGDFAPTDELRQLTPEVDYSTGGISNYPLLLLQVTYFKCGGVSLGFSMKHLLGDGFTIFHFINSWSDVARGAAGGTVAAPFLDRTLLLARNPPTPCFPHVEYAPPPSMDNPLPPTNTSTSCVMFKLTREQLNLLKKSCRPSAAYSTFVVLAAYVWRCVCVARELPQNQMTKLYIPTNGRLRLFPPLPKGYFGNVLFAASPLATAGELTATDGYSQAAERIHAALSMMDDEYLRSAMDFLEMQPNLEAIGPGPHLFRCPNLRLTSWIGLPVHDADFGWGRPVFTVPGWMAPDEGLGFMLPSPVRDGSVSLAICLQSEHMMKFQKLIYRMSPLGEFRHPAKL